MARPGARKGDIGSGHESFPPTDIITASGDVIINDEGTARKGDALTPHGSPSPSPPHGRSLCGGSKTVATNDKNTITIGDPVCCGGLVVTGSEDVVIGG